MPWTTPTLSQVRQNNRDYIVGWLGAPLIPNSVGRVLADANGGNAHLALQYLDWLSLQLLPDTAETVFLDKWANIFLTNADGLLTGGTTYTFHYCGQMMCGRDPICSISNGVTTATSAVTSTGRKQATYSSGYVTAIGLQGAVLPAGTQLTGAAGLAFETTAALTLGPTPAAVQVRALDAGSAGNLAAGTSLSLAASLPGVTSQSVVVSAAGLTGGTDEETDDELRARVLSRIRQPPMGGDADDYVNWALQVPGVTRAWCAPGEMGIGTVTVRIMCDDLRASNGGLPTPIDLAAVQSYLDTLRPVTVKEFYVLAPTLQPINFAISNLQGDSIALRNAIAASVTTMLAQRAAPASAVNGLLQPATTIPAAWVSEAIYSAAAGGFFDLTMADAVMPNDGCLAVLGTIG